MAVCRVEMFGYTSLFYVRRTLSRACLWRSLIENMPFFPEHSIPVAFAEKTLWLVCGTLYSSSASCSPGNMCPAQRNQRERGKEGVGDSQALVTAYLFSSDTS